MLPVSGTNPFQNKKLSRADVEWLLATLENGRGPIDWHDEIQRERWGLDLRGADLRGVDLHALPLARIFAGLIPIHFVETDAQVEAETIHLEGANLSDAHLEGANLSDAHLERANLSDAHLERANLSGAHLERANLGGAHLEGTNLTATFFDSATNLIDVHLSNNKYGTASFRDIHWGDINIAIVDWSTISRLGDENEAKKNKSSYGYERAARAYRQLSVVLRNQGVNEHAARFSYRSQLMQRKVFWYQHKYLSYLGSLFLDLLSGYGYKVGRCFIAYALVIGIFATIYHLLGTNPAWNESIVISMTAFHGRGFFPEQFHPGDPQALAAAIEAFVGLLIEITLIATLTQRFFGK